MQQPWLEVAKATGPDQKETVNLFGRQKSDPKRNPDQASLKKVGNTRLATWPVPSPMLQLYFQLY